MTIMVDKAKLETKIYPSNTTKPKNKECLRGSKTLRDRLGEAKRHVICLSRSMRIYLVDVSIIVGKEKISGKTIKTLYVGESRKPRFSLGKFYSDSEAVEKHDNYLFLMDSIYSDYKLVTHKKNVNCFHVNKWIKIYEAQVDLVYVDVELLFSLNIDTSKYISLPQWVPQKLSIPDTWEEVLQKFRKNHRKALKKNIKRGYRYLTSNEEKYFNHFYNDMYATYSNERFGNLSVIFEYKYLRKQFDSDGFILFLVLEEKIISGALLRRYRDKINGQAWGTSSDLKQSETLGAFDILVYNSILEAFEKGCNQFDFMGSRPFLNNGPFQFKRKWGTTITKYYNPLNYIYFKVCDFNVGTKSYVTNNPMITVKRDKFIGRILLTETATRDHLVRCLKRYNSKGLYRIDAYCLDGIDKSANEFITENSHSIRGYDIKHSQFPEKIYCKS